MAANIETSVLLGSFEREVLRSICRPVCEQGKWNIQTNRELTEIFGEETIIGAIKSPRLRSAGYEWAKIEPQKNVWIENSSATEQEEEMV